MPAYRSQFEWMRQRARTVGRVTQNSLTGTPVTNTELDAELRNNLANCQSNYPMMPADHQAYMADLTTFIAFWGTNCLQDFQGQAAAAGWKCQSTSQIFIVNTPITPISSRGKAEDAMIFNHVDAWPRIAGQSMQFLRQFQSNFPRLRVNANQFKMKNGVALWLVFQHGVDPALEAAQEEYDAVMSGLREYHKRDKDPKLPYIHGFYERNPELFHVRGYAPRFTPTHMNSSRPQMGSEPPQYPINSQALTLRQSKQSSNLSSSSSHDEPQRHQNHELTTEGRYGSGTNSLQSKRVQEDSKPHFDRPAKRSRTSLEEDDDQGLFADDAREEKALRESNEFFVKLEHDHEQKELGTRKCRDY